MLLERLKSIVGPDGWVDDPQALQPHLTEWRDRYVGRTPLMVAPANTGEVSEVVKTCAEAGIGIVPQGGNTGLCGGAMPDGEILLSLNRMRAIRSISPGGYSIVAEAGCILADVQAAAARVERLFPLSIAAEGSCRIGGNLSTNAGGINVLRYGNAREQVLGLEVVLADGRVWNGLRTLRKDTAGYDLKQLFIGAEGTLGVITAAALRLYPRVRDLQTALVAVSGAPQGVALLSQLRDSVPDRLQAFELIQERALDFVLRHIPGTRNPFERRHPCYVLLEVSRTRREELENVLANALEASLVADAVIAKNEGEAAQLWRLRHSISEAQKHEGASLKHDVSVPIDCIGDLIEAASAAVLVRIPEARIVAFGHVGDGNVHFNVSQPHDWTGERFLAERDAVAALVYDLAVSFGGSISAEHGIGLARREDLRRYRGGVELELMRTLKAALDPANIMNPGKVL